MKTIIRAANVWYLMVILIVAGNTGCAVHMAADYDEQIELSVTRLQIKVETFFNFLERTVESNPEAVAYESLGSFYDEIKAEISGIKLRAALQPKNELTTRQLDQLRDTVKELEAYHQEGFTMKEEVVTIRSSFEIIFKSILEFELAKKRGQK